MANCVNKSLPEFKQLATEAGINPLVLAAKIGVWQESNGLDNWPTLADLGLKPNNIKSGVEELFESNPELANSVYSKILTNSGISGENLLSLLLKNNIIEKQCL